ncbi:MAG: hypothetical protein MK105_07145 [Crocinitomicaceae bacterium]|nr:hypothetical protein [Crocinitomicaceae bacterium]
MLDYDEFESKIETAHIVGFVRTDDIVHVHIKDNVVITKDVLYEMHDSLWKLTEEPRQFVFQAGSNVIFTHHARKHTKVVEETYPVISTAIIVDGLRQRFIANLYFKLARPKRPSKSFTSLNDCLAWSKEIKSILNKQG